MEFELFLEALTTRALYSLHTYDCTEEKGDEEYGEATREVKCSARLPRYVKYQDGDGFHQRYPAFPCRQVRRIYLTILEFSKLDRDELSFTLQSHERYKHFLNSLYKLWRVSFHTARDIPNLHFELVYQREFCFVVV